MDSVNMTLTIDNVALERKAYAKFLGIYNKQHPKWHQHIDHIHTKLSRATYVLRSMKNIHVFINANTSIINETEVAQKKAIGCIESAHYLAHSSPLFERLHMPNISDLHKLYTAKKCTFTIKTFSPFPFRDYWLETDTTTHTKLGSGLLV